MDTTLEVTKPANVEFTLSVTMTLEEWRTLAEQLEESKHVYPAQALIADIRDMTSQAKRIFWPEIKAAIK